MTYWRVYGPGDTRVGVIGVPAANPKVATRQTLYLPNALEFTALWDKAKDRPVVIDTPPAPVVT